MSRCIDVENLQGCKVVAVIKRPATNTNITKESCTNIYSLLRKADTIIDIPCFLEFYDSYQKHRGVYTYANEIQPYMKILKLLTQSSDNSSAERFLSEGRYIRYIEVTVRKNDIEFSGDIDSSLDFDYPELQGYEEKLQMDVFTKPKCKQR